MLPWETLEQQYLIKDEWIRLRADRCRMSDGTIVEPYYVLEYPNWANVIAITEEKEVVLVRQYRHALGAVDLELPGGAIDPGESPMEAAKRELLEETGFEAKHIEQVCKLSPNPANHNNYSISFLATGVKRTAKQQLDETEEIEVVLVPLEEVKRMLARQELIQTMHVAAFFYAMPKLEQLS
ncbi:NUDIX hydrolase [Catalinimonas niigatensis]|uniref:NUDIX hydrolase n=1 Tax=Catalinimonas niigatensis TaxID=1397264 RepID=UPI00266503F4|nr:NUDIX hydrolase [Catalinimonas niigatensis]WPP48080.1 NUDIX hydrolase [Catalinimonas niigatensis]